MSERITRAIDAAESAVSNFDYDDGIQRRVVGLGRQIIAGDGSPCDDALICARTSLCAAVGMATAIEGGLHPTEIHDRETLRHVVAALRSAADLFEAILREGVQ